jgi:hypothetical protein
MSDTNPLIFTSKGNLPVLGLKYETRWEHVPDQYMKFCERYVDEAGDVVRESAHVYSFFGVTGEAVANPL